MSNHSGLYAIEWDSCRVIVAGADAAVVEAVSTLLALPVVPVEPGESPGYIVAGDRALRLARSTRPLEFTCRDDLIIRLVALISVDFLNHTQQAVLHSGGFVAKGQAALFCGPERVGKSALAYTAWRLGYPVIGDDWVIVDPGDSSASPFPKPMKTRVDTGTLPEEVVRRVPPQDRLVGRLGDEYRLVLGRSVANMVPLGAKFSIGALFLLERGEQPETVVSRPRREDVLEAAVRRTIGDRGPTLAGVRLLNRLRQTGRIYALAVGDQDVEGAVTLVADVLKSRPPESEARMGF